MVFISKIVGLMSCGCVLWLGLSHTVQAGNAKQAIHAESSADPTRGRQVGVSGKRDKLKGSHRIEGEVLRIEGQHYVVLGRDGKEVRLHSDQTTRKTGNISQGTRIVASINDQNHVRSIRLADMADIRELRNETIGERTMASGLETDKPSASP